ncbi:hypothetical protein [Nocardioides ochotonae]|uniref:hypothetical protein n=1 Tax=Nocardioides ochotonae TaxID=2685869 RepID=UPI001409DBFF|nr:hypothetical protein [Nocardioides ochotonae]
MTSSTSASGRLCAALVAALLLLTLPLGAPGARADEPAAEPPGPSGPSGSPAPMVVGDLGAPAAGVTSRWVRLDGPWAVVGADGRFSLSAPSAPARLVVLQEYGAETSRLRIETAPTDLSAGSDLGVLDVPVLEPVTVRVVDAGGRAVPGAAVTHLWGLPQSPVPGEATWEHAGHALSPGLPVERAAMRASLTTDASGEVSHGFTRSADGRILSGSASFTFARHLPPHVAKLSGAQPQPDGSLLVRLADLVLPEPPGPVGNLRAVPGDGGVLLQWDPPAVAGTWRHYVVTDVATGVEQKVISEFARVAAPNGVAGRFRVRAVGLTGESPEAVSASVTPRALRVRLVGPRDGALVLGPATYRVVSSLPLASLDCSSRRAYVRGCATGRITVRAHRDATVRVTLTARDSMSNAVRLRRSLVPVTPATEMGRLRGWTRGRDSGPHLTTERRGAHLLVRPGRERRELWVAVDTGRGRGVLEAVDGAGRSLGRVDLARRPAGRGTLVRLVRTDRLPRAVRLVVRSTGRPVTVRGWADLD